MHNSKMNQTIIKDRIVSGSSEERIVYIGVVCSHFDFACSSATSNIAPLGIEEAFLKDPFLPLFSQQTLLVTSATEQQCSTPSKRKWKIKVQSLPFNTFELQLCLGKLSNFLHLPVHSAYCWPITPSYPTAAFPVPGVLHSPHHLTLSEIRQKIHRELV